MTVRGLGGLKQLLQFADKHNMLPSGAYVLCAVSGGADSMCLLSLLNEYSRSGAIRIAAAHFDHGLRGEESDRDAEFVRLFCAENDIAFFFGAANVRSYAENRGLSVEMAARELRYDFLRKTAQKIEADRIATAHTADDNAETLIMNLLRGTGLKGLCGIPPVRGNIIRPILSMTRAEVLEYLSLKGIPHIEDSSNDEDIYLRNRLRHSVIPMLKELNPRFIEAASETAELVAEDEAYLSRLANKVLWSTGREACGIRLAADELRKLPKPVIARVIIGIAEELKVPHSRQMIDGIAKLAFSESPSAQRSFSGGLSVIREYGDIIFTRLPLEAKTFRPVRLEPDITVKIPELGLDISYSPEVSKEKINNSFNTFLFKSDSIYGKITVRPRKTGDKITFSGKNGTKTLKKLFIDEKLPLRLRESIPVFTDEKGVIAVLGYGTDIRCVPSPGDKISMVSIEKTEVR